MIVVDLRRQLVEYVAVAEALRCPLVTTDLRLLARAHGHDAEIRSPV